MVQIRNTKTQFGLVSVLLHWVIAASIGVLLITGMYMITLPDAGFTTKKVILVLLHKQLGVFVFFAVLVRLIWRCSNIIPKLPETLPPWQLFAANLMHWILYLFMLALPISGWLMSSAGDYPTLFMGYFLPDLISYNFDKFLFYRDLHKWMAYALFITISGHTGAALFHHFILKDNVLRRMVVFWK